MTVPTPAAEPVTPAPYRSVLDQAQDRLDQMKASLEASQRDPIGSSRPGAELDAALKLDSAVNLVDLARHDINALIRELPEDTPMFATVDIVNALWNLRNAAVLLDKAADALEVDAGQRHAAVNTADDAWADPAWQVDSTTRSCCGGIGDHTRECQTMASAQAVATPGCGLDGCEYDHDQIRWTEHSWSDTATARTVSGKPHTITVFAAVDERVRQPDEVCLAIQDDAAPEPSAEVYLTASEVERLHDLLGSAIHRIATFQPNHTVVTQ